MIWTITHTAGLQNTKNEPLRLFCNYLYLRIKDIIEKMLIAVPMPVSKRMAILPRPNISSKKKYSDTTSISKASKKGQVNLLLIVDDGWWSLPSGFTTG
jgi:hypothetical protein